MPGDAAPTGPAHGGTVPPSDGLASGSQGPTAGADAAALGPASPPDAAGPQAPGDTPTPVFAEGPVRKAPRRSEFAVRLRTVGNRARQRLVADGKRLRALLAKTRVQAQRPGRAFLAWLGVREGADEELAALGDDRLAVLRVVAERKRAPRVLFVDTGNGPRSMMAEAYALTYGLYAESAGSFPVPALEREAIVVMQERRLDISQWRPKLLVPQRMDAFDRVIVMGDSIPEYLARHPNVQKWKLLDPAGFPMEGYRMVRDQADREVRRLAKQLAGLKTRRTGAIPQGIPLARTTTARDARPGQEAP